MGWTYFRPPARKDSVEILRGEFPELVFVEASMVSGAVYAAVHTKADPANVFGLVVLVDRSRGQFGYKEMTEDMGPNASDCPASILDKLTATPNKWALQWRERCRANYARRQAEVLEEMAQWQAERRAWGLAED